MGAECIGKSPRRATRQPNPNSQITPDSVKTVQTYVELPPLVIKYHKPSRYPLFTDLLLPPEWQLNRQYCYQDYFELTSLASNTRLHQNTREEVKTSSSWGVCSDLNRDAWQLLGMRTMVINGSSYALADIKSYSSVQATESVSKFKFDFLPKTVLKLQIGPSSEGGEIIKQHLYQNLDQSDLTALISKEMQKRGDLQHVKTDFLSGFICYRQEREAVQSENQFILELMGTELKTKEFTFFLFCNQTQKYRMTSIQGQHDQKTKIKPSTYWEIQMWMKRRGLSLWDCDLAQLFQDIEPEVLKVYCAVQMLRCVLNRLQRQYLEGGLYLSQNKDFIQKKVKLISKFIVLDQKVIKEVVFMTQTLLCFHKFKGSQNFIQQMIQTLAFELSIVSDALFCEFGLEINQKQHPFRNDPYHFLKFNTINPDKSIRVLKKHILPIDSSLACQIIQSIQVLCNYGDQLSLEIIQHLHKEVLTFAQKYCRLTMKEIQNQIHFQDYLLRISMLRYLLGLIRGYIDVDFLGRITEQFQNLDLVSSQAAFVYLVLVALSQSIKRGAEESTEEEKKSYLKALEMGLKLFGDPRASRQGTKAVPELVWLLYLVQNYCGMYSHSAQKLQYNFLKNLKHCLKEDLNGITQLNSKFENQDYFYNYDTLVKQIPLRRISGSMIRRSEIWDNDKEASKSNYSEYGSSSAIKRLNKSFYKVSEWEFGLKPDMSEGALLWGHSVPSPPQTIPTLKNCQILSIAAGNYHVVFVTEEGVFGWGENHSGQLGKHNEQKVYKEAVRIESRKVNRKIDKIELSCGNEHTTLLMNSRLTVWGQQDCGINAGNGSFFDSIACGGLHTLGLREGKTFSWGRGEGGQLGHPFTSLKQEKREETTVYFLDTPTEIDGIEGIAVRVACGDAHSLVLTADGRVWVFGFSYQGQLGLGMTGDNEIFQVFEPTQLLSFKQPVTDLWAGPTSSFFKTSGGDVYSCGYNDCLQLGIDRVLKILQKKKYIHRVVDLNKKKLGQQEFSKPRKLDIFREEMGMKMLRLECGQNHCLALVEYQNNEKLLVGWGLNRHFQLDFKISEVTPPRTLDLLHSVQMREFCCGSTFSIAVVGSLSLTFNEALSICEELSTLAR